MQLILNLMRTAELLKHVRALSPAQRAKLLRALSRRSAERPRQRRTPERITWPDVEARARRIFGNRTLPNLVLMDREERAV